MPVYELTRTQDKLLSKSKDVYMIGRLRNEYPIQETQNGNIKFYITPLCDEPKVLSEIDVFSYSDEDYIGMDTFQSEDVLPTWYDVNSYEIVEKYNEIDEHLSNKLIIFKPQFTQANNGKWYKNVSIKQLMEDNLDRYFYFYTAPKVNLEPNKFEQLLKKGEYFDLLEYDDEVNEMPDIIICGQFAYRTKDNLSNLVIPNQNVLERWRSVDYDNIVKVDLTKYEDYKVNVIRASNTIVFIEENLRNLIMTTKDYISLEAEPVAVKQPVKEETTTETSEQKAEDISQLDKELAFLKGLQQLTMNRGLRYEYADLVNFHTSIKTNSLTILAGMSGTGKTQLAYNYAKMLNLSEDNDTLLFMPISPAYTEPTDVLGYLNSMNGLYVPSETGFVNFLQHASLNTEQMHMVIFDEMNLSQVEYWFSPFISILEKDTEDRYLQLYDQDAHCINEKIYPSKIKIGENIVFVGTVNIDDTTKDFSDRLLDRTFVISLNKVDFSSFYREMTKNMNQVIDIANANENVAEFMRWNKSGSRTYLTAFDGNEEELTFLDELDELIQKYIFNGGISYRVLRNIGNYLNNVPMNNNNMIIERKEVFDTIINQTIMTKIRGTETQLAALIGTYDVENDEVESSAMIDLLSKYSSLSGFEKVKKCIKRKAEELRVNGYTN